MWRWLFWNHTILLRPGKLLREKHAHQTKLIALKHIFSCVCLLLTGTILTLKLLFSVFREYATALLRLAKMIRGIGNPLVAAYARCYLCRIGITLTASKPENASYLLQNFYDFLRCYNHVSVSEGRLNLYRKRCFRFPAKLWSRTSGSKT